MNTSNIEVQGRRIGLDDEGFMLFPDQWDDAVARALALSVGLELTEERWEIVRFVRRYFEQNDKVPEARKLISELRAVHGHEKATRKYIYELFPYGYGQQACKIAGMRKPLKLLLDV